MLVCTRNRKCCINLKEQRTEKETSFPTVDSVVYRVGLVFDLSNTMKQATGLF